MPPELYQTYVELKLRKGFKFLDINGRLMTEIADDFPRIMTNDDGAIVGDGGHGAFRTIRMSHDTLWAKFHRPDSVQLAGDQAFARFSGILDLLEVTELERVGLRAQFIIATATIQDASARVAKVLGQTLTTAVGDAKLIGAEGNYRFRSDDELMRFVRLAAMAKQDKPDSGTDDEDLPQFVVLLDIDIARDRAQEGVVQVRELRRVLRQCQEAVHEVETSVSPLLEGDE